jgi:hypothetical protein
MKILMDSERKNDRSPEYFQNYCFGGIYEDSSVANVHGGEIVP